MTPQSFLDPGSIGVPVRTLTLDVAPRATRSFGYVPDLATLMPGDLLLFSPVTPRWTTKIVASAQERGGFIQDNARWTHAAVFLFETLLVEALPFRGVVRSSVLDYVPGHCIRVRRAPGLSMEERYIVALRALSLLGEDYSHLGICLLYLDLLKGLWSPTPVLSSRSINICSSVFHDALVETSRRRLDRCPLNRAVTPAHLSATSDLDDVWIEWMRLG